MIKISSIPRPLVRLNQSMIAISSILSIVTGFSWILLVPIMIGISSLFFNYNPLMDFGKRFLRKPLNEYLQEDKEQQRFNQILALSMLTLAYLSSMLGFSIISYVFATMVFLASSVAKLGFCIGCFIHYQYNMWKYRRSLIKSS